MPQENLSADQARIRCAAEWLVVLPTGVLFGWAGSATLKLTLYRNFMSERIDLREQVEESEEKVFAQQEALNQQTAKPNGPAATLLQEEQQTLQIMEKD